MAVTTRPASTETIKNFNVTKKPCWMDGWIVDERKSGSEIVAQETGQPMNGLSEIKYHINGTTQGADSGKFRDLHSPKVKPSLFHGVRPGPQPN